MWRSILWQISPSRRSDKCSTREHDDGGIGDAVPMRSFRHKPDAAHCIVGAGFNSSWGIFLKGEKGQGIWGKARGMLRDNEVDVGRTRSRLAGAVENERCVFTGVSSVRAY